MHPVKNGEITRLSAAIAGLQYFEEFSKRVFASRADEYFRLDGELFDHATGGSFQVKDRLPDPERYLKVSATAGALRRMIRDQRRRMYWAH